MIVVLVTGGFDPLHSGHVAYLEHARKLGDKLLVGVNSDEWLIRKKGRGFMPYTERETIVQSIGVVDAIVPFNDDDGTANDAINEVKKHYSGCAIVFANGGDRELTNIPEVDAFRDDATVTFAYGIGGGYKKNSSRWILDEWKAPKTVRIWGYYSVLYECNGYKVKLLSVDPGKSLSTQKHQFRSEYWFVSSGSADVLKDKIKRIGLQPFDQMYIPQGSWHKLENNTDERLDIIEIQYGEKCMEEDIIREKYSSV
jgi:cytidyltransferase-like protein